LSDRASVDRASSGRASVSGAAGSAARHPRPNSVVSGVESSTGVADSVSLPPSDSGVDSAVPVVDSGDAVSEGSSAPVVELDSPAAAAAPVISGAPRAAAGGVRG
jgi:hypothetical protein